MKPDSPHSATDTQDAGWRFDNSYARLNGSLSVRLDPVPVRNPRMAVLNRPLCVELGLQTETLAGDEGVAVLAGNRIPAGAEPVALAYAGHQFGHFTKLGDGRAILLGEHLTPDGRRFDIQLKGSGQTPFSRDGDGRAALGPMLREYIISEAMFGLGIPTTRSLAVVTTGEPVFRETPLRGAILTRVAASHIRIGTFEHLAARGEVEEIRALAEYCLRRHYPERVGDENPCLALLGGVMERQASLVARWLQVGFIHGVMNTDNMALSGETIDYGPCAFMDSYDPATVFSSIDRHGRYAFGNQARIAQWNLARFAESLLPLLHEDRAQATRIANEAIASFPALFQRCRIAGMRAKLGLCTEEGDDVALVTDFLACLQRCNLDYTATFRSLAADMAADAPLFNDAECTAWFRRWKERLGHQPQSSEESRRLMRTHNPAVIPRNYRVEQALAAAEEQNDYSHMEQLLMALARPYDDPTDLEGGYHLPPQPGGEPYKTFCGT
jgi:uncharacterized protein YdiU (UPF0061 family)